ncbi:hypothetical protein [Sporomusa sp. KB1]|jgi:hypothetical protein|uniref:hypothetical protein n=1 Tax=Sporomusa sp. KB1 TaxID=943346 RepID=UPI001C9711F6|nr:hypothetical protein [Sporomusa sp. KB1]
MIPVCIRMAEGCDELFGLENSGQADDNVYVSLLVKSIVPVADRIMRGSKIK